MILDFLRFLKDAFGLTKATLCGGDPLSRPDILLLLKEIKALGFFINLDTVGTPLLNDSTTLFYGRQEVKKIDVNKLVSLVDLLGIPLDGDSNESFATFRKKRPEIYNEQIAILNLLELENANVCINTVAHKQNLYRIENIFQIIKNYECIRKWQIFQYMPIGPLGFKNRVDYFINDYDFANVKERVEQLRFVDSSAFTIEYKSCSSRKGVYLLIDSDGVVWIPKTSNMKNWDSCLDANNERVIFGNINARHEYPSIAKHFFDFVEVLEHIG